MIWSAEQQRQLAAMGFQPMVRVAPGEMPGLAESAERAAPASVRAKVSEAALPGAGSAPAAVSTGGQFSELRSSIRRAAGDREVDGLIDDLERLRREPALKRALWPKLKALRRSN